MLDSDKLDELQRFLKSHAPHWWSEVNLLKRLIVRHKSQHRRMAQFHHLRRVYRLVMRVRYKELTEATFAQDDLDYSVSVLDIAQEALRALMAALVRGNRSVLGMLALSHHVPITVLTHAAFSRLYALSKSILSTIMHVLAPLRAATEALRPGTAFVYDLVSSLLRQDRDIQFLQTDKTGRFATPLWDTCDEVADLLSQALGSQESELKRQDEVRQLIMCLNTGMPLPQSDASASRPVTQQEAQRKKMSNSVSLLPSAQSTKAEPSKPAPPRGLTVQKSQVGTLLAAEESSSSSDDESQRRVRALPPTSHVKVTPSLPKTFQSSAAVLLAKPRVQPTVPSPTSDTSSIDASLLGKPRIRTELEKGDEKRAEKASSKLHNTPQSKALDPLGQLKRLKQDGSGVLSTKATAKVSVANDSEKTAKVKANKMLDAIFGKLAK